MLHVVLLLACAGVIYLACEWFVNGVEWLGVRLRMGPVAVGTILAAAGTALPESVVTLVAVLFGSPQQGPWIGIGAALGGPLVVGTIGYAVLGGMLVWRRRSARADRPVPVRAGSAGPAPAGARPGYQDGSGDSGEPGAAGDPSVLSRVDGGRLSRDQTWFVVIFAVKVALGLVAFALKPWVGLLFFAAYGVYFWREVSGADEGHSGEDLEPLKLQPRRARPGTGPVLIQTLVALVVVFGASQLFVAQLEWAGPALGLPAVVVALLLSPVATELPEIMNTVIWVRQGKAELAAANLSGAMMIQATVPSGIGLLFTPWLFDAPLLLAGAVTLACVLYLNWLLRSGRASAARLMAAAGFYLAFGAGLALLLA